VPLNCAWRNSPERFVFLNDDPQDFTGVNIDTGKE
jgi:hypothetical protein